MTTAITSRRVLYGIGLVHPQEGQTFAVEDTLLPHSLHLISTMAVLGF